MYKSMREYGIGFTLAIHWLLYYFSLFNNYMDWGFSGELSYSIQWGSLPLLGIGVALTFSKCLMDCNIRFLNCAIFSMALRMVIIIFKPWGLDSSIDIMIICMFCFLFYFPAEFIIKKVKRSKLYI